MVKDAGRMTLARGKTRGSDMGPKVIGKCQAVDERGFN